MARGRAPPCRTRRLIAAARMPRGRGKSRRRCPPPVALPARRSGRAGRRARRTYPLRCPGIPTAWRRPAADSPLARGRRSRPRPRSARRGGRLQRMVERGRPDRLDDTSTRSGSRAPGSTAVAPSSGDVTPLGDPAGWRFGPVALSPARLLLSARDRRWKTKRVVVRGHEAVIGVLPLYEEAAPQEHQVFSPRAVGPDRDRQACR